MYRGFSDDPRPLHKAVVCVPAVRPLHGATEYSCTMNSTGEDRGPGVGGGSLGWLVDFRAQIPWSEPPRMAVKMGGWVCKISNFQDI